MRFQPVTLEGDLSFDQLARVESHLYALPGVLTDVRPRRDYVGGDLAAHLIGTIGEIRRDQLESDEFAGYRQGEVIGQTGVEQLLEPTLRGQAGGRNVVVNVAGRVMQVLDEIPPVPGGSVTLTIDLDLQRAAEEAFLPDAVGEPAKMGAAVAIDVRSGEVLALVSKPAFDPNDFSGGVNAAVWKQLTGDEWRPLQNRAISGQYPPGSTYKAIVAAAALAEKVTNTQERVFCPGYFHFGNRAYRCWKKEGHGSVDLHDALKKSCDVYFYTMGLRLGVDRLADYAHAFGLGRRTGIPLPQEKPGLIPTSAWKQKRFHEKWMAGETVSIAIGQGYDLVTPLQLAVSFAALANGGRIVQPRLVLSRRDASGEAVPEPYDPPHAEIDIPAEALQPVLKGLEAVVEEPGGTGSRSRVPGVRVGGKTGTAQTVGLKHTEDLKDDEIPMRYRDHGWFAAFAPVDAPEIAVAVLNEHGGGGGATAAPIAQKILQRYFEKQGRVPPQEVAVAPGAVGPPGGGADSEVDGTRPPAEPADAGAPDAAD
jgi:penicillin-binding protein 2